ncbi:uncharacterized protein LOC144498503 [Mustelus asterias]
MEERAMELAGGDGPSQLVTDSQHATLDPEEPGRSGVATAPAALEQTAHDPLDDTSEGGTEESSEGSTTEASPTCTIQPTNTETITRVDTFSVEASGSRTDERITGADAHQGEMGTSEGSGTWKSAGGQDLAVLKPAAGPLGLFLPRLVEMHQQTQGVVERLSATMLQLQGCLGESNRVLLQEVVPTQRANQANTARVAIAVESLAQGSVLMGGRVQAILETQRAMGECVSGIQEAQRSMAMGVGGMWETLLAMAGILAGILETRQAVAVSLDNLAQAQRATAEGPQSLTRSQNAVAEGLQSFAQSQRPERRGHRSRNRRIEASRTGRAR